MESSVYGVGEKKIDRPTNKGKMPQTSDASSAVHPCKSG